MSDWDRDYYPTEQHADAASLVIDWFGERDLVEAIRDDKPYNETERGVKGSLVTSMGRMAAHTGQEISFEAMLNCEHEFAPDVAKLTADGPAPVSPGSDGKYPVPMPGIKTKRLICRNSTSPQMPLSSVLPAGIVRARV